MDRHQAQQLAEETLAALRSRPYRDLVETYLDRSEHRKEPGPRGAEFQIEVTALWDTGAPGDLRVMVSVDDGRWSAFKPLTTDFVMAPDGSFVGE